MRLITRRAERLNSAERVGIMKKYRVNESEHFNLMSMYEHLKCMEIDAEESDHFDESEFDELEGRIEEVESLLDKCYCVGALVDWSTLEKVRKIKEERQFIRYSRSLAAGSSEQDAALSFEL